MIDYKAIFKQIKAPLCILSTQGIFLDLTEELSLLLGYQMGELSGKHWWELSHPDESSYSRQVFQNQISRGFNQSIEVSYKLSNQEYRLLKWNFQFDATQHHIIAQLEESIQENLLYEPEESFLSDPPFMDPDLSPSPLHPSLGNHQLESKINPILSSHLNFLGTHHQVLSLSPQVAHTLGYEVLELEALGPDPISKIIHPEDLDKWGLYQFQINKDLPPPFYNLEVRLKHKNGTYQWISLITIDLKQEDLQPLTRFVGLAFDISDIKMAQNRLQHFFSLSQDLWMILSVQGKIAKINKAWNNQFGYSESHLQDQPLVGFLHPDDQEHFLRSLQMPIQLKERFEFTNRLKDKDGNFIRLTWKLIYLPEEKIFYAQAQVPEDQWEKEEAYKKLKQEWRETSQLLRDQESELALKQKTRQNQPVGTNPLLEDTSLKKELMAGIAQAIPAEINVFDFKQNLKIYSNAQLASLLAYTPDEFQNFGEDALLALVHPDDASSLQEKRNQVSQGKKIRGLEIRVLHREGHFKNMTLSLVPLDPEVPGQVLSILQDFSEQKSSEKELKKLNKRLQEKNQELAHKEENLKRNNERLLVQRENIQHTLEKLLQSQTLVESIAKALPAELNALDVQENQLVFSNHKLAEILGYDSDKLQMLLPDPLSCLTHPQDLSHLQEIHQELENQEIALREVRVKHADGHYLWLSVISVLLKEEDRSSRYQVTLVQDITERKLAEEKISATNEKLIANQAILERALAELSDRNFELDQIVYKISHDLRSPLSTILGLVNLIKFEKVPSEILQYVHHIETRVLKLDGFVRSMLNYAKASRAKTLVQDIDFEEIILNCLADLEYIENFRRVQTDVNFEGDSRLFKSDSLKIRVIFNNIISNAYKYMNIRISPNFLKINIRITEKTAFIDFIDNGIGIDEKYLGKIFNMFFRATQKSDGSGLGMYIVKQTVEKLDGKIRVDSALGQGTSFHIEIPNLA